MKNTPQGKDGGENRNMKYWFFIFVSLLLMPLSLQGAQKTRAEEVVQRLKESREKTRDFSADLYQEKRISLLKEKVVSRGRIRFKKPDKVSIEFFPPESSQMVFDGKTVLLYLKEEKMAERYRIQGNPAAERYLLFSRDPFQEKLATWRIVEEQKSFLVMEILPKEKEALFSKTKLWISKEDWMVTGMEMVETNGDTTFLRYSNVKVNTGLKDSDFQILLPTDVKVTDIK
jgi:outer membrane lipoprotein carrier protein